MERKPVAIVLGGTSPHAALILELKGRGYRTVLVDYLEDPPAKRVADEHVRESTLNREAVLEIARAHSASLVISVSLDQPIPVVAYVSEQLGLPTMLSSQVAHSVTDKRAMKKVMLDAGIPTPWFTTTRDAGFVPPESLKFPVVVKPVDGTGSLGVSMVAKHARLAEALQHALKHSASKEAIVEEFKAGLEMSVDCIVIEGKPQILLRRERHSLWTADKAAPQCFATLAPANLDYLSQEKLESLVEEVVAAFGLDTCPLLIQAVVGGDGQFSVLEIAARLGGGPSAFRTVKLKTGVDLLAAAVSCAIGEKIEPIAHDDGFFYATNNVYATGGQFGEVKGYEALLQKKVIEEIYIYRSPGNLMDESLSARNRACAFITKAASLLELREKVAIAMSSIDVLSQSGASIIRRDIGLHVLS